MASSVPVTQGVESPSAATAASASRRARRSKSYIVAGAALLAIVLIGFSRTLYMRGLFDVAPIRPAVWAHGVVLSAWFVGFLVQASLVAGGRVRVHRRLGYALAAIAAAVVVTSIGVMIGGAQDVEQRLLARGLTPEAIAAIGAPVVWSNIGLATAFTVLVAAAVALRRRPEAHKRLMLLATVGIVQPAIARITQWPVAGDWVNARFFAVGFTAALILILAVPAYELARRKTLHPATAAGAAWLLGVKVVTVLIVARSEAGQALVRALF